MEIKWLGHSCFMLKESTGTVIITDPFNGSLVGYDLSPTKADIVTISHNHDDHNFIECIESDIVINESGIKEYKGVSIIGFDNFHDAYKGKLRGRNIVYKYRIDGMDVCHFGDQGEACNVDLINDISPIDILLIPIGGKYTINAEEAKAYIDALMPSFVIPMHYKTKKCKLEIDKLESFLKLFNQDDIIFVNDSIISIDRDSVLFNENTKVVVLDNKNF